MRDGTSGATLGVGGSEDDPPCDSSPGLSGSSRTYDRPSPRGGWPPPSGDRPDGQHGRYTGCHVMRVRSSRYQSVLRRRLPLGPAHGRLRHHHPPRGRPLHVHPPLDGRRARHRRRQGVNRPAAVLRAIAWWHCAPSPLPRLPFDLAVSVRPHRATTPERSSALCRALAGRCLTALLLLPDNPPAAERARAREAEVARDVPRAKERRGPPRRQLPATEKALDVADAQDSRKVSKPGMVIIAEPNRTFFSTFCSAKDLSSLTGGTRPLMTFD
jgi:hypothetical protein